VSLRLDGRGHTSVSVSQRNGS